MGIFVGVRVVVVDRLVGTEFFILRIGGLEGLVLSRIGFEEVVKMIFFCIFCVCGYVFNILCDEMGSKYCI